GSRGTFPPAAISAPPTGRGLRARCAGRQFRRPLRPCGRFGEGEPMSARILVVDDEPDISALVAYQLARESCRVRSAASGPQPLEALEREVPDLVILDLMLPGMSGLDVLGEIRRREEWSSLPVILLTARREGPDRV